MNRAFLTLSLAVSLVLPLSASAAGSTLLPTGGTRGDQARTVAKDTLAALADRTDSTDTQWYGNGVWRSTDTSCWACESGPGTLSATLWRVNGRKSPALFNRAVATFDAAISAHENANGSFGDDQSPETQFFGVELGTTYLLLGDRLGPKHRAAWSSVVAGAADYLIAHKDITWVANGNISLGNTELEWLAWAITGKQRFRDAYELSWKYTIHPPQSRWPGYGLHITRQPTPASDDVGAGYLGESGGGAPGFDPEYTMLQLSVASRAYLLSHDPRFRWLSNLLWNQLSPRVTRPAWTLDARGGTRRSNIEMVTTPGMAVLATAGGRSDLLPSLDSQTAKGMYTTYLQNARQNWGNPALYRGYGGELSVALLALASPPVKGLLHPASSTESHVRTEARHVSAFLTSSGVHVSWRAIAADKPRGGPVYVIVDGEPVKTVAGSKTVLRLTPGLHQISIAAKGLRPGLSTVVTVPAR